MAQDIIAVLDQKNFNEFKKDFIQLVRVYLGVKGEYSRSGKHADRYVTQLGEIISLFNKKYRNITLRIRHMSDGLQLGIFLKEKSVKDAFVNAASKIDGIKSIGVEDFDDVKIEEVDKFSRELDKTKDILFISYDVQNVSGNISLEKQKNGDELHFGSGISRESSPAFKLCAYYAAKEVNKLDVHERLAAIGFLEAPLLDKVRRFLTKFSSRIEE